MVTIILIAYHGERWLPACVESLAGASTERLHLVIVDNAGDNRLGELDLSAFDIEIIETPRPMGFADANNHALVEAASLGDHVLFLNQDTVSPPGWIDACLRCLDEETAVGAISPVIRNYEGDGWDSSFLDCLDQEAIVRLEPGSASDEVIPTKNAPAPALIVRTDVLRNTGPFDPVFGSYYEDYDLCRRIRALGYGLAFCHSARVRHFSGGSTVTEEQQRKRMRQIIRNRALYEVRESAEVRWRSALRWMLLDFPRRLLRGLAGTPSSQPPAVTLQAYGDLLRLGRRFLSGRHDERAWQAYLRELGWPPPIRVDESVPEPSSS